MGVGENIKKRRKQLGMSAETLAEIINVAPTTIYRYESGAIEKVDSTKLEDIANALQTTPASLMGWDKPKEKLKEIGDQLTAATRSKEWRVISEGFANMERESYAEFMAYFNMLRASRPELFKEEGDDDDDTRP